MTTESMCTTLQEKNGARHSKKLFASDYVPNNQLCIENWGGHYTSFVVILRFFHLLQNKEQCKKLFCSWYIKIWQKLQQNHYCLN